MNRIMHAQHSMTPNFLPLNRGILQRKCICGSHTMVGEECGECAKKKAGLQRKLAIGASNDPLELEADRVADQVLSIPSHSTVNQAPVRIQRFTGQASESIDAAPPRVGRVLASPGSPLEPGLRQDMEQRFGHDFSHVRVHFGQTAEQSAQDVNAYAYTVGHHIVFGSGQFSPGTGKGQRLLAHELTHVVQQNGGIASSISQNNTDSKSINEQHARSVSRGLSISSLTQTHARIHRQDSGNDAGAPDAGMPDAGVSDAGRSDAGTPDSGTAETGSATPAPRTPNCVPTALSRAEFLRQVGASQSEFGLTTLVLNQVTFPELLVTAVRGGVIVQPTTASLPTIHSIFTGAGTFTEGTVRVLGGPDTDCPTNDYPIRWLITPDGASKIAEAEQEHCDDFHLAFNLSVARYRDAINRAATSGRRFRNQAHAEQVIDREVGFRLVDLPTIFECLTLKTLLRDSRRNNWHTPRPRHIPPSRHNSCGFVRSIVAADSLRHVGQHPSTDIIRDCGEIPAPASGRGRGRGSR